MEHGVGVASSECMSVLTRGQTTDFYTCLMEGRLWMSEGTDGFLGALIQEHFQRNRVSGVDVFYFGAVRLPPDSILKCANF